MNVPYNDGFVFYPVAVGKNLFFTCKAEVSNPALVRDLKWLKPNGQNIPEDDR